MYLNLVQYAIKIKTKQNHCIKTSDKISQRVLTLMKLEWNLTLEWDGLY